MKAFVSIPALLVILYLVGTYGRHLDHDNKDFEDLPEAEEQSELVNRNRDHNQMRHRRRSRQMHPYDYPPPYYYDNRRDYNIRQQEEYLSQIVKTLDEIISYQRRPPQPAPQPVYIPYPVIQYVPCACCPQSKPVQKAPKVNETTSIPELPDRFPSIEDVNQLWTGTVEETPETVEDYGSRPISLIPIEPNRPTNRPPPAVEHGSNQEGLDATTSKPVPRPGTCETAILMCCSYKDKAMQRTCFEGYGCVKTFLTNGACHPTVINKVLEYFSKAYAPVKKD